MQNYTNQLYSKLPVNRCTFNVPFSVAELIRCSNRHKSSTLALFELNETEPY